MDLEGLYEIVKQGNETTSSNIKDLKTMLREQNIHLRSKINTVELNLSNEIKELKNHQVTTNGRIDKSEQELRVLKWIKKHPVMCGVIFLLLTFVANFILTVFSLKELIQLAF